MACERECKNTLRCIRESGVRLTKSWSIPSPRRRPCSDEHQKELGAVVIDIGGGVTDYIVYENGVVRHSGFSACGRRSHQQTIFPRIAHPAYPGRKAEDRRRLGQAGTGRALEKIISSRTMPDSRGKRSSVKCSAHYQRAFARISSLIKKQIEGLKWLRICSARAWCLRAAAA